MRGQVYKKLIKIFADGRQICNCGEAYYNEKKECNYGCSANQISAKYEIAERILKKWETDVGRS